MAVSASACKMQVKESRLPLLSGLLSVFGMSRFFRIRKGGCAGNVFQVLKLKFCAKWNCNEYQVKFFVMCSNSSANVRN